MKSRTQRIIDGARRRPGWIHDMTERRLTAAAISPPDVTTTGTWANYPRRMMRFAGGDPVTVERLRAAQHQLTATFDGAHAELTQKIVDLGLNPDDYEFTSDLSDLARYTLVATRHPIQRARCGRCQAALESSDGGRTWPAVSEHMHGSTTCGDGTPHDIVNPTTRTAL